MEKHYHRELESLKSQLLGMARKVQGMLSNSIAALTSLDAGKIEEVNSSEHDVNLLEIEIDGQCLKLIALYQPVGQDLRLLNIVSKINNDLERVGDEAVNICERVCRLIKDPRLERGDLLPQMYDIAKEMLDKAIVSLEKNDLTVADDIFRQEDILDDLNRRMTRDAIEQIKRRPEITDLALDIISISHRLERIGDMAVNIAEDIIFFITGEDARHPHDKVKS
ncbi:MAG: phosphate transport system regulatory protein PhoU [Elusimicrobia bacterium RIFOXYA2_FULL_50_26]|nr:MAG: phosphate transport system regulatory protein PhoU [Elusimicrobia bacterium RIFOXYA2_FULL_50_26]OGS24538.1 MAG: phosphate transport system regulatory protein PhoU [Elusimicrobia bacterium RIFOXYB2_FULL_50_12]